MDLEGWIIGVVQSAREIDFLPFSLICPTKFEGFPSRDLKPVNRGPERIGKLGMTNG